MAAIKLIFMNLKVPYRSDSLLQRPHRGTEVKRAKSNLALTITCVSNFDGKITAF